jgi:hypothetical protein
VRPQTLALGSVVPVGAATKAAAYARELTHLILGVFQRKARICRDSCLVLIVLLATAGVAHAQLNGLHIKGDFGLDAGSQAPPGPYYGVLFYNYDTSRINDQSGNPVVTRGNINAWAAGGLISVVTQKKILGANYGFTAIPLDGLNTSLEFPRLSKGTGVGFGDTYVQPISLGWHLKQADVTAGFGIYLPTGRYTAGNPNGDNTGLGMWGFEPSIGTTVHLNKAKTWNVSTLASIEFNTDKRDTSQHVGDLLTLEGGLGRKFLKGAANIGVVYYAQWKLTNDTLTGLPPLIVQGKNSAAAVGPELTIPLATKNKLYGFFTFRYEWEVYAKTTTQGNAMIMTAVFPFKPIKLR